MWYRSVAEKSGTGVRLCCVTRTTPSDATPTRDVDNNAEPWVPRKFTELSRTGRGEDEESFDRERAEREMGEKRGDKDWRR